ncbi:unnamed protein product, partial [Rodentolepis nana]|uniref:Ribosome biogenesis protein RLP24 n=1 Tax=Rodentolepis nana TaxID=102285 RepID=A0A0R3TFR4_RODNA
RRAFTRKKAPRKTKWTKTYRKSFQKDLSDDFAQTFERKRNEIQKYSRDNLITTLHAIDSINRIKEKRERMHIMRRLQKGVDLRKKEDIKLVETQMHLIKAPNGKISVPYSQISSAREKESEEDAHETTVEEMEVEMENLESKLEKEAAQSSSKTSSRRQKLLAKV